MMLRRVFLAMILMLAFSSLAFADMSDKATLGGKDTSGNYHWRVDSSGNLIPGTTAQNSFGDSTHYINSAYVTALTTSGAITSNANLLSNGIANGGASIMSSASTAIPLTYSFVQKNIGDSSTAPITLANGKAGQIITIAANTVGTGSPTCAVTPTTKTGWATFTLAAAKDSITLLYVNDTTGWVVVGVKGGTLA